jgi:Histidine kinase
MNVCMAYMNEPAFWIVLYKKTIFAILLTMILKMSDFKIFILGFSSLMCISTLFKSAINGWERANLYCALMFAACFLNCLCNYIHFDLANYGFYSPGKFETNPSLIFNHLIPTFLLLLYRDFLNVVIESPRFYKMFTYAIRIIFVSIFINVVIVFLPKYGSVYILSTTVFQIVLLIVFMILPFYALRFWRHPIFKFAAWSSWSIIGIYGSFLILTVTGLEKYLPHWIIANMLFVIVFIDGILFLFALTMRDRQLMIEKIQLEQQATLSELKALRTQMNPHFIFNCLNAIKSYTLNKDTEGVNFYLTKFSKLMRQVLENSRSEKITLNNELETLRLYMDMEKLRAGDKFDYEIKISDDIETDFIEVPPMLIQPYVENAIWHGLMHKEGKGKILIALNLKEDKMLIINVLDDGVGRKKAIALKSKTATRHKSYGMTITSERMDIIRQLYNINTTFAIEDLENTEGEPIGTNITLEIPI